MPYSILVFAFSMCVFVWQPAHAKTLGVVGSTWEIVEQDIRVRMANDAAKVNWEKVNQGIADDAKGFIDKQKQWDVPYAQHDSIRLVDISQELTEDMMGYEPLPDGSFKKKVLFKKGYRLNPLERMTVDKWFAVISGESEEQIKWAESLHQNHPERFVFVTTDGKLSKLNKDTDMAYYPINTWLFATAGVQKTPSIVGVSKKEPLRLTVAEFAPPYKIEKIKEVLN